MSVQIGIDLVEVAEIERSLACHGGRFLERVFTDAELTLAAGRPSALAARFAGKEATMKAMRIEDDGIGWTSIEITGRERDPRARLSGEARALAARRGVRSLSLSLRRDGTRACAVAVAEVRP